MKKTTLIVLWAICVSVVLAAVIVPSVGANSRPWKAEAALKSLRGVAGEDLTIEWSPDTGTPSFIGGKLSRPSKHTPAWISYGFLEKHRALYGIRDVRRELRLESVERLGDGVKVHMRHVLFRIPVWEDKLTVVLDKDGIVREVAGSIYPGLETKLNRFAMHSAYSEREAIRAALNHANGEPAAEPVAEKYYLASRKGTPLVYIVSFPLRHPDRMETFVIHSMSGRIIDKQTTAR